MLLSTCILWDGWGENGNWANAAVLKAVNYSTDGEKSGMLTQNSAI